MSFTRNHVHLVFSTKDRSPFIKPVLRNELYCHIRRVATGYGISIDLIGGTEDHVHILFDLPPKLSLSNLVAALKAKSSKWMNEHGHRFAWQNKYGCFSVSTSHLEQVKEYIAHQEEHHRGRDFLAEFNALLRRHGIKTRGRRDVRGIQEVRGLPPFGLACVIAWFPGLLPRAATAGRASRWERSCCRHEGKRSALWAWWRNQCSVVGYTKSLPPFGLGCFPALYPGLTPGAATTGRASRWECCWLTPCGGKRSALWRWWCKQCTVVGYAKSLPPFGLACFPALYPGLTPGAATAGRASRWECCWLTPCGRKRFTLGASALRG